MDDLIQPTVVDFPLEGEWFAPNTPGTKIPSHGVDMLGQRYAYDFIKAEWSGIRKKLFIGKSWRYYLLGKPLTQWYGWGQSVYAPCDGEIIIAKEGLKERKRVHLLTDLFAVLKNPLFLILKNMTCTVSPATILSCKQKTIMLCLHIFKRTPSV